jgi:hypothetical protein
VPYRDRKYHMNIFNIMMNYVLEDYDKNDYEIYFAHQNDDRPFNRGAMKNIGFLAMKEKYPNNYQDITFVFNDVDTVPCEKGLIDYQTTRGIIKHYYGFKYALGGIFSITGFDFELINGFPCYWSWGYEDNVVNTRANKAGLIIDRSVFYKVGNQAILQTVDSFVKNVNKKHREAMRNDNFLDGINTINNITYDIEDDFINFKTFEPINRLENEHISQYNMLKNEFLDGSKNTSLFDNINNINNISKTNRYVSPATPVSQGISFSLNNKVLKNTQTKEKHVTPTPVRNTNINMNMQTSISREKFIRRGGLNFMK